MTLWAYSPPKEDETRGYDPTLEARYHTSGGESSDDEALTLSNGVTYEGGMVENGCSDMDDETLILEKMYMVHTLDGNRPCLEDDEYVGYMEPPTSTTPISKECDYKGNNIGVGDSLIPLVDMMIHECLHDIDDSHAICFFYIPM
jgi:hypothetical protein